MIASKVRPGLQPLAVSSYQDGDKATGSWSQSAITLLLNGVDLSTYEVRIQPEPHRSERKSSTNRDLGAAGQGFNCRNHEKIHKPNFWKRKTVKRRLKKQNVMICKSHNAIKPKFLTEKTCNFKKTIFLIWWLQHISKSLWFNISSPGFSWHFFHLWLMKGLYLDHSKICIYLLVLMVTVQFKFPVPQTYHQRCRDVSGSLTTGWMVPLPFSLDDAAEFQMSIFLITEQFSILPQLILNRSRENSWMSGSCSHVAPVLHDRAVISIYG